MGAMARGRVGNLTAEVGKDWEGVWWTAVYEEGNEINLHTSLCRLGYETVARL